MVQKILVSTSSFAETSDEAVEMLRKSKYEIINNPYKRKLSKSETRELINNAVVGIIAGLEELSKFTLKDSNIKVISRVGSGISNIDQDFIKEKKIKLFTTPLGPVNAVSEITVMNMLNLLKHSYKMNLNMHNNKWERILGNEIKNKNVVIFGYGRIGKKVSKILECFSANVFFVDPFINKDKAPNNLIDKNQAITIADIITIHISNNETIIFSEDFKKMKKNVIILNSSRGKCVLEDDLINALNTGVVGGAWIDTFEQEPYNGPLKNYDNVILTPHSASYTQECRSEMELEATKNILNFLNQNNI